MNPMLRSASLLAVLALVFASRTWAADDKEDLSKPGPEHKLLASLEGTYEATVKSFFDRSKPPEESTGTMQRKMIMGGRFLQERYEGKVMGEKFSGMGITGYDNLKKKFTVVWIDSMSTGIMHSQGAYDAGKKTFTNFGEDVDPYSGKKMKSRDVLKIVSDTEQLMEVYRQPAEGNVPEFKVLEIRYTRKKPV